MFSILKHAVKTVSWYFTPLPEFLRATGLVHISIYYDLVTAALLRKKLDSGSVFVDVGCNVGEITELALNFYPGLNVHAFEPIPRLAGALVEKFQAFSGVRVHNLALNEEEGRVPFFVVQNNTGYSGMADRSSLRSGDMNQRIEVNSSTLDKVVGDLPVDLIKIDVEGAELKVLRGARELLLRASPWIVFEHQREGAVFFGHGPRDLYAYLCVEMGYEIGLLRGMGRFRALTEEELCRHYESRDEFYFLARKPGI